MNKQTPTAKEYSRSIKQSLMENILAFNDTAFIHCLPHKDLIIGRRGLQGKEKTEGIVLVLGPTSYKDIVIEEDCIKTSLQFGQKWENITIPLDSLVYIWDKHGFFQIRLAVFEDELLEEADTPTITDPAIDNPDSMGNSPPEKKKTTVKSEGNAVAVDFIKRKKIK